MTILILGILMKILCTIEGTDYSQYLRALHVNGTGPGIVGSATLYLDKAAGGLTIKNMQEVKVWVPFDETAGTGVATRGRLFGGVVTIRRTGNKGATKTWELDCSTFAFVAKKTVTNSGFRPAVAAGDFATQMASLVHQVQWTSSNIAPLKPIDASQFVANLVTSTIPAQYFPGGKSLDWYVKEYCSRVAALYTTIKPRYFWDVSHAYGAAESFGTMTLHVYDAALTPSMVKVFSDDPGVGEFPIFPDFERPLDATSILQRLQGFRDGDGGIFTYQDDTAKAAYPNPWVSYLISNTGYWQDEVPVFPEDTPDAEINAKLKAQVDPKAFPKERVKFWTDQLVLAGEYIGVTYALEGLSLQGYRVVDTTYDFTDPMTVWTYVNCGNKRRELFDTDDNDADMPPVEGDGIPPDPPSALANTGNNGNAYDPSNGLGQLTFQASASPSADVAFYRLRDKTSNALLVDNIAVGVNPTCTLDWEFDAHFGVVMTAVDSSGNESVASNNSTGIMNHPNPAAPSSLAVGTITYTAGVETCDVQLTWTATAYSWPSGYYLEIYHSSRRYRTVNVPLGTSFTVPAVAFANLEFRLYTVAAGRYTGTAYASITQDTTPNPAAPTSLTVADSGPENADGWFAHLTWTASTFPAVFGYYLVAEPVGIPDTPDSFQIMLLGNVTTFTLHNLHWGQWRFKLRTMVSWNYGGAYTSYVNQTIASPPIFPDVYNGGFEQINPYAPTQPLGWLVSLSGSGTQAMENLVVYTGKRSVKLTRTASAGTATVKSYPIAVEAGRMYWIDLAHNYTVASGFGWPAKVYQYSLGGSLLTTTTVIMPALAGWERRRSSFTTVSNAVYVELELGVDASNNQTQTLYLDDVHLTRVVDGTQNEAGTIPGDRLAASGVSAGTYRSVTVNTQGLVTAATNPTNSQASRAVAFASATVTDASEPTSNADVDSMSVSVTTTVSNQKVLVWFHAKIIRASGDTRVQLCDGSNTVLAPLNSATHQAWYSSGANGDTEKEVRFMTQITIATAGTYTLKVRHQAADTVVACSWHDRCLVAEVLY